MTDVTRHGYHVFFSSSLLLSSLELIDTNVCAPYIQALLGPAAHFCKAVVRELRTVPCISFGGGLVGSSASERSGNTLEGFQEFYLKAISRIWS
jgi:hypothetical protein